MAESADEKRSQAVEELQTPVQSSDGGAGSLKLGRYSLSDNNMGRFIILNMKFIEDDENKTRSKSETDGKSSRKNSIHDVKLLEEVMRGLEFDVITHQDLTASDIHKVLAKYANDNEYNKNANCIGVAAMSHSTKEGQFQTADMAISIDEILKPFKLNKKNEELRNKPRFFFFQCCRGTEHDMGHRRTKTDNDSETSLPGTNVDPVDSVQGDDDQTEDDDRPQLLPVVSDMICAYSTYQGYTARLQTKGSPFIQKLGRTLEQGASEFHLLELLTIVCKDVTQKDFDFLHKDGWMKKKQTPTIVSSLTKKFYLKQP